MQLPDIATGYRLHGAGKSRVVVLHGGPGAAGEVGPLARNLVLPDRSVLEPFQTARSIDGQIEELHGQIVRRCDAPVVLIGWSWGAWLGLLYAARHPDKVGRLVVIGCPPFKEQEAEGISATRLARLDRDEVEQYERLSGQLGSADAWPRLSELFDKMDGYSTDGRPAVPVSVDRAINQAVWRQATTMRRSGEAARRLVRSTMPGDCDPRRP